MSMMQIRNVPPDLHRALKARAAETGVSLSRYLLEELEAIALRPTIREWAGEIKALQPVTVSERPADVLRAEHNR